MNNNSEKNSKHTWKNLGSNHPFPALVCFFTSSNSESPYSFSFSHIYIYIYISSLKDLNLFPKRKFSYFLSSSLLFPFLNLPIQKQSSQFQIPLQNLPRRVPPFLNSNDKFPCKSMKFLKVNN